MLRIALLILLLANAGYFAWSQGALASLGWAPTQHSEPERLRQQLQPEALQLLPPASTAETVAAATPAPAVAAEPTVSAEPPPAEVQAPVGPTQCLQAGIYDDNAADTLRRALLLQVPEGSWNLAPITQPGRWMVYMGKFADSQALEKKRAELVARKLDHDRAGGALEPGLSLGRFSSEEAATRELTQLVRQGVRSARVVQERPDRHGFILRLPAATPSLRAQVEALPAFGGKALRGCGA
ncbi:SPOR domain-containing protein [Comamonas endophytica]|uniref:SPOR domain-containing protein n=1 Tax=Comamonas endophytica TaxID=2949090 RepID=A0ABY6G5H5_9BURK|nr:MULTISPECIES: SPOR domain-containing protein [unclassified Acidovorax]MCD2512294.1 SPOR domain-containing protein [Acidovorax sp. D4N7]UYG50249.1 SPOR domain-containing protein [Acidovorax sp. 5MLIR]